MEDELKKATDNVYKVAQDLRKVTTETNALERELHAKRDLMQSKLDDLNAEMAVLQGQINDCVFAMTMINRALQNNAKEASEEEKVNLVGNGMTNNTDSFQVLVDGPTR